MHNCSHTAGSSKHSLGPGEKKILLVGIMRETEKRTDRETDRTDKQRDGQRDGQRDRQTDRQTDRHRH